MRDNEVQGYWKGVWIELKKDRLAVISLVFIIALCFVAIFQDFIAGNKPIILVTDTGYYFPVLKDYDQFRNVNFKKLSQKKDIYAVFPPVPYSPTENDLLLILKPPSSKHYLGTDDRGRDVLSRMIHGTRISLSIGVIAVGISMIIGVFLGAVAGYYGGTSDFIISRL